MYECPYCGKPVQGLEDYRVTLTHTACLEKAAAEKRQRYLTVIRENAARTRNQIKWRGPVHLSPSKRD